MLRVTSVDPRCWKARQRQGASHILTGSFMVLKDKWSSVPVSLKYKAARLPNQRDVKGPSDNFFELQSQLGQILAGALGIQRQQEAPLPPVNLDTLLTFSKGLAAADTGDFSLAADSFRNAQKSNPNSSWQVSGLLVSCADWRWSRQNGIRSLGRPTKNSLRISKREIENGKKGEDTLYGALLMRDALLLERAYQYALRNGDASVCNGQRERYPRRLAAHSLNREASNCPDTCGKQADAALKADSLYFNYLESHLQTLRTLLKGPLRLFRSQTSPSMS